jgi:hypothetical protein
VFTKRLNNRRGIETVKRESHWTWVEGSDQPLLLVALNPRGRSVIKAT